MAHCHPFNSRLFLPRHVVWAGVSFVIVVAAAVITHRSQAAAQQLSFEARIAAQRAIEEVYHRHRLWPADNPQPKPALDEVLTEAALRAKVEDYLRMSRALEVHAARPVTAADLQAEIERQARATHQPDVLRELWAALGNDPLLIAECLARPIVVERELRQWQAERDEGGGMRDEPNPSSPHPSSLIPPPSFPPHPFDEWWRGVRAQMELAAAAGGEYWLPEIAAVAPCGSEIWTPTTVTGAPSNRTFHTVVWTGSEMIVWGGGDYSGNSTNPTNTGGRYNPATDSWIATSTTGAPSRRNFHTAVWTGSEMIVWGGNFSDSLNTGGRYNPATNTWIATNTNGAPSARDSISAVWTGSEMIIWGGFSAANFIFLGNPNTGARYNPTTDTWVAMSVTGVPPGRASYTSVWTGIEMIVWGGQIVNDPTNTGGRYNPITNTWVATAAAGAPNARVGHRGVWTGSEMIIWGGSGSGGSYFNTGGRYNPVANTWVSTSTATAPIPRESPSVVWTGSEMIVFGGSNYDSASFSIIFFNTGGRYDPTTDSWIATTTTDAPRSRTGHTAVWTGNEIIVWGGYTRAGNGSFETLNMGNRYLFARPVAISQTTQSFPATSSTGNIAVTAQGGCTWTATTNANWLTITAGSSGAGNGTVAFTVAANTLGPRTGLITINNQTFTVTQAGVATPRVIRVVATSAAPGTSGLAVPIELVSQGDENALGFTLSFDPGLLSSPQASLGADAAGAQLATVTTQTAQGRIGIGLALAAGQKFAAGTRQIAVVTFNLTATATAGMTTLDFGDQPLQREVSDASAVAIPAAYTAGSVTVVPGYESDVTPRPNGSNNGTLTITDWVQVGRFAAGLDTPAVGAEFQRADCAPRDTKGDGRLTISDWVQAGRYLGTDPAVAAGGPTQPTTSSQLAEIRRPTSLQNAGFSRNVRATTLSPEGGTITIELDARGNENALGFSLRFDPAAWRFVAATVGRDAAGATLHVNDSAAKSGSVGVALAFPTGRTLEVGARQLVVLNFAAVRHSPGRVSTIEFSDFPVARELADTNANLLSVRYVFSNIGAGAPAKRDPLRRQSRTAKDRRGNNPTNLWNRPKW